MQPCLLRIPGWPYPRVALRGKNPHRTVPQRRDVALSVQCFRLFQLALCCFRFREMFLPTAAESVPIACSTRG